MDDVFTATEQEIEDATKFTLERAKQAPALSWSLECQGTIS